MRIAQVIRFRLSFHLIFAGRCPLQHHAFFGFGGDAEIADRAGSDTVERFGADNIRDFRFVAERINAFQRDKIGGIRV